MANEIARKLRKTMTRQEAKLWQHLRELRKQGFHFRRQVPIDDYIVDFACFHPKVAVEVDGSHHSGLLHSKRDAARDAYLIGSGFKVDVDQNLDGVLSLLLHELEHR